ncbi:MAG: FecR domain-containing protein [Oceanospirillaceae bacterium]
MGLTLLTLMASNVNIALAEVLPSEGKKAGTFKVISGSVTASRNNILHNVKTGDSVFIGDLIITAASSFAGMTLYDNTRLTSGPNSRVVIDAFSFNTTTHKGELSASLDKGSLAVISGQLAKASPEKVVFNTRTMTVGVRGTEFIIEAYGE